MSIQQVLRRLRAYETAAPVPVGAMRNVHLAPRAEMLRIAFVRMGGESLPWGIGWRVGSSHQSHVLTVPDPRNREAVARMLGEFAPVLLAHLLHPAHAPDADAKRLSAASDWPDRQIWIANSTHAAMLHNIAYAYHRAHRLPDDIADDLRALGRAAGWLFRESHRAGQTLLIAATTALRQMFEFPADDARQSHLGFLLAWLETHGTRESRMRAALEAQAEPDDISLPAAIERDFLQHAVDAHHASVAAKDAARAEKSYAAIHAELKRALEHRLALTDRAIGIIIDDARRENPGLQPHVAESLRYWRQGFLPLEFAIADDAENVRLAPSPETDRDPVTAAWRYQVFDAAADRHALNLLHFDAELQADAVAAGRALRGIIERVRDENPGRATRPVWDIACDSPGPIRPRVGDRLCVAGTPGREVIVRSIARDTATGGHRVTIEIVERKTDDRGKLIHAADRRLEGQPVVLVAASSDGFVSQQIERLRNRHARGAWFTHDFDRPEPPADPDGEGDDDGASGGDT